MYDPLYLAIPAFERETGIAVEVVAQLPHPELNAFVRRAFESGACDLDLLSTHTKYAPSQADWLSPLDDLVLPGRRRGPAAAGGGAVARRPAAPAGSAQPRRTAIALPARSVRARRRSAVRSRRGTDGRCGCRTRGPSSPTSRNSLRGQGLAALCSPGGAPGSSARSTSSWSAPAGICSTWRFVRRSTRRPACGPRTIWPRCTIAASVTPRGLPGWHYDEISASFREGRSAMVCDWPGSYHLYTDYRNLRGRRASRAGRAAGRARRDSRGVRGVPFVCDRGRLASS